MDVPTEEIQIQVQIEVEASAFRSVTGNIQTHKRTCPVSNLVRETGACGQSSNPRASSPVNSTSISTFYPGSPMTLVDFHTPYPELPTLPSDMERFQRAADQLANRLQDIPLETNGRQPDLRPSKASTRL